MNLELKWNHFVAPVRNQFIFSFQWKSCKKKKRNWGVVVVVEGVGVGWGGSLNISSLLLFHREPRHCLETVQRSSTEAY